MSDGCCVGLGEAFGDLSGDVEGFADGQGAGVEEFAEGFAFDQLHGDVVDRVMVAEFVDGDDVGVIEGGGGTGFAFEAVQTILIGGKFGGKDFYGDGAVEAGIVSAIDFAHSAGAKGALNFVGAKFCASGQGHEQVSISSALSVCRQQRARKDPGEYSVLDVSRCDWFC